MKITKIFLAMALLFAVACTPDNGGDVNGGNTDTTNLLSEGTLCGEWQLASWANNSNSGAQVYLALNEDSTFDLYQRVYQVVWLHYTGTYTLAGNTLSGVYTDGEAWSKQYTVSYAEEPTRIRLVSTTDSADKSVYTEVVIPTDIIDAAQPATEVRSVAIERFL